MAITSLETARKLSKEGLKKIIDSVEELWDQTMSFENTINSKIIQATDAGSYSCEVSLEGIAGAVQEYVIVDMKDEGYKVKLKFDSHKEDLNFRLKISWQ